MPTTANPIVNGGEDGLSTPESSNGEEGEFIRAKCGVISNASVWDTQKLLPAGAGTSEWREASRNTPQVGFLS
jgi:hypothetical protein